MKILTPRLFAFSLAIGAYLTAIGAMIVLGLSPGTLVGIVITSLFLVLGVHDLTQREHSILRLYPIIGHVRWLVEAIRPEIRQYLLEGDDEKLPFSRSQRSLVYQRAKGETSDKPFGTLMNVYAPGHEFIGHSTRPAPVSDPTTFRVKVGGPACKQPYDISVLNVSAMSFGSLSANAIRALNKGAKLGGFIHDTGEGAVSPYHLEHGGDLIWELGSGYFGCRTNEGRFDPDKFAALANRTEIKMIEVKLSQGAKPGHGGILPAAKITPEISRTRGVPMGVDCVSPSSHPEFDTPVAFLHFVRRLRELSNGKPVGFKLCLGHPWEFMGIVKAMLETGILVDFVVVDGAEGGTGAAPVEFVDHMGVPLREGLLFVHNTLVGAGLRDKIRIGASGKIVSAFDIAAVMALGADWANSARGFMFALGCIQSQSCHTNRCPTGVATQDEARQRALVVPDKAERVHRFHRSTLHALADMLAAAGLRHPSDIAPRHMVRRVSATEVKLFSELHAFLKPRALIDGSLSDGLYAKSWEMAAADSFDPAPAEGASDAGTRKEAGR